MTEFPAPDRAAFAVFAPAATRWNDDDAYGHMNNVVYYALFDTAVNRWLRDSGALPVPEGEVVGLVVETACRYRASVGFTDRLETGLALGRAGRTSVVYHLGLFREGAAEAAAVCRYAHVYVDRESRRPTPLPLPMRHRLDDLRPHGAGKADREGSIDDS